ncbi:MAG TPA: DUF6544 family protein [Rubrivivax sp.]|nr:DUF6544 family protein [Rubrivivax sp.]
MLQLSCRVLAIQVAAVVLLLLLLLLLLALGAGVQLFRFAGDERDAEQAWSQLAHQTLQLPDHFDPNLVAGLPEPARRFFGYAILPGTRLSTVVEISMRGEISLGTKDKPNYQPMTAVQLLAPPRGMVWKLSAGQGLMRVAGSDGLLDDVAWTRFWLLKLIPVARVEGTTDHLRSAFGRVVAEAALWAPAFLLPRAGVTWTQTGPDSARATVVYGSLHQDVDVTVNAIGQPLSVSMPRWTNANPEKVFRLQPFGGEVGDFREVSGYRLPFRVDGGNHFGTAAYFAFYRARVERITVR